MITNTILTDLQAAIWLCGKDPFDPGVISEARIETDFGRSVFKARELLINAIRAHKLSYVKKEPLFGGIPDNNLVDLHQYYLEVQTIQKFFNQPAAATRPQSYLDETHPYYSPELEAAVSVWLDLYGNGRLDKKRGHKEQIRHWLHQYRPRLSKEALGRICTLVNPHKTGGAPLSE